MTFRFGRVSRWAVVVAVTGVLVSMPAVVAALPVSSSGVSASQLLARIEASRAVAYSGYAESTGGLDLPISGEFGPISDLFSGATDLRVWYRSPAQWRADTISAFGESDVHDTSAGLWTWDYESDTATLDTDINAGTDTDTDGARDQAPRARLPRADDLLPAALAQRVLSGVDPSAVSRIGDARIAGRNAAGLRLRPSQAAATIDHVDVWALPGSGLPVRVEIYAKGSPTAVLSTSMLDVSTATPASSTIAFTPPPGATVRVEQLPDVVAFVDRLGTDRPPLELAGLPQMKSSSVGAVGVYGQGITVLAAVPLPPRAADSLRTQLLKAGAAKATDGAVAIGVAPLNLRLTAAGPGGWSWLLVGTVTAATLASADAHLPAAGGRRP